MCFIIPQDVLLRLADDDSVADDSRTALAATAASETAWRTLREAHTEATQAGLVARIDAFAGVAKALAKAPGTPVFDCKHTMSLPGSRWLARAALQMPPPRGRSPKPLRWQSFTRSASAAILSTTRA